MKKYVHLFSEKYRILVIVVKLLCGWLTGGEWNVYVEEVKDKKMHLRKGAEKGHAYLYCTLLCLLHLCSFSR